MTTHKTSVLNGRDLGKIPFNFFVTYRPTVKMKYELMEDQVKLLFRDISFEYLHYTWERDRENNLYHSHILLQDNSSNMTSTIYKNIKGYGNIRSGEKELELKTETKLINPDTGTKLVKNVIMKIPVTYTEMSGRFGKVYLEPVVNPKSVSYYCMKFTSSGVITGYLDSRS